MLSIVIASLVRSRLYPPTQISNKLCKGATLRHYNFIAKCYNSQLKPKKQKTKTKKKENKIKYHKCFSDYTLFSCFYLYLKFTVT